MTADSSYLRIPIRTANISLGQFLKLTTIIPTGGLAKLILQTESVFVNDQPETRRGRTLKIGDRVVINPNEILENEAAHCFVVTSKSEGDDLS